MSTQTATRIKTRQIELKSRPDGVPTEANFQLGEETLSPIAEGEFLVQNEWMSVDPYMRGRMNDTASYVPPFQIGRPLEGGCVGRVIESLNENFAVDDYVLGNFGWREKWKSSGEGVSTVDPKLADPQTYLSTLGMTGMTAWAGLTRVAKLKPGSTVFVSAASGAVGSIVCQIAMLVFDFLDQRDKFLKDMSGWIKSGAVVWEESITDGLENAPAAFIGLFKGDNMGKSLIRLG